jgi:hypothetical protein
MTYHISPMKALLRRGIISSTISVISALLASGAFANAEFIERDIEMNLDPVANAQKYEVRVTSMTFKELPPIVYKIQTNHFTQRLRLGKWRIEGRSIDGRGVAGRWSALGEVNIGFKTPKVITPKSGETIQTSPSKKAPITIQWESFSPLARYRVQIFRESLDRAIFDREVKGNQLVVGLPHGRYTINLKSLPPAGVDLEGQDPSPIPLTVSAGKLSTPNVQPVVMPPPLRVTWQAPPSARNYQVKLIRVKPSNETKASAADVIQTISTEKTTVALPTKLAPGSYRVEVVATAPGFEPSDAGARDFVIAVPKPADEKLIKQKLSDKTPESKSTAPEPKHVPVDFIQGSVGPVFWSYNFSSTSGQTFNLVAATITAISADLTKWFGQSEGSAWAAEVRGRQTNIYLFDGGSDVVGQEKVTIADRRIAAIVRRRSIIDRVGIDVLVGLGTHHYTYLTQNQLDSIIRPVGGQLLEIYLGGALDWQVRKGSHTSFDLTFHPVRSSRGIAADQTWQYTATLKYMRQFFHDHSYISVAMENYRSRINTHSEYFSGEAETISNWYRLGFGLGFKL